MSSSDNVSPCNGVLHGHVAREHALISRVPGLGVFGESFVARVPRVFVHYLPRDHVHSLVVVLVDGLRTLLVLPKLLHRRGFVQDAVLTELFKDTKS